MLSNKIRYTIAFWITCILVEPLTLMAISNDIKDDIIANISVLTTKLPFIPDALANQIKSAKNNPQKISDEALEKLIEDFFTLIPAPSVENNEQSAHYNDLAQSQESLITLLKSYRVSGFSWSINPNFALIINKQDPTFTVTYRNPKGEIKNRTYQAAIDLVGINAEISCRFSLIFFTNTDANFYNTNKPIKLGRGLEIGGSTALFTLLRLDREMYRYCFETREIFGRQAWLAGDLIRGAKSMYVPFINAPGGLIILSNCCIGLHFGFVSMITGGTLTPVN